MMKQKNNVPNWIFIISTLAIIIPFFTSAIQKMLNWKETLFIILFLLIIFLFLSFIQYYFSAKLQLRKSDYVNSNETPNCIHDEWKKCCIDNYAELLNNVKDTKAWTVNTILKEYNLKLSEDMMKQERNFGMSSKKGLEKKEVWICSFNLGTEIGGDGFKDIVKRNLRRGVKYIEFYYEDNKTKETVKKNKKIFREHLKERPKVSEKNVSFIPLKNSSSAINILPVLLGFIIFCDDDDYHLENSYFSLRGDLNDINSVPIYYRMPTCMSRAYYEYFKPIREENNLQVTSGLL